MNVLNIMSFLICVKLLDYINNKFVALGFKDETWDLIFCLYIFGAPFNNIFRNINLRSVM